MNVLVIGAAGRTGRLVVDRAVAAGHTATALVRNAESYRPSAAGVRVVAGDATDPVKLSKAMTGQDAVIDTIASPRPYVRTDLEQRVAVALLTAMRQNDTRRSIVVSALGVGDSRAQSGFFFKYFVLPTFLRGSTRDKAAMEHAIQHGGVEYVIVRPAVLTDHDATGAVRVVTGDQKAHEITRADLAQFLVDQLEDDTHLGQSVTIANQ